MDYLWIASFIPDCNARLNQSHRAATTTRCALIMILSLFSVFSLEPTVSFASSRGFDNEDDGQDAAKLSALVWFGVVGLLILEFDGAISKVISEQSSLSSNFSEAFDSSLRKIVGVFINLEPS